MTFTGYPTYTNTTRTVHYADVSVEKTGGEEKIAKISAFTGKRTKLVVGTLPLAYDDTVNNKIKHEAASESP